MNIALLVYYILGLIVLLSVAYMHGKKKEDNTYNFWLTAVNWIIRLVFMWWALGWRFI